MKTIPILLIAWTLLIPVATRAQVQTPNEEPARDEPTLRLHFREAPLDLVLDYLSEAAGFTIVLETKVEGTVDMWSNQLLTKAEAVDLLNSALNRNGYAAIQDGRKLTILTKEEAKKRNIPVRSGNDPEEIPKSDEMVTQIIPVRYINAPQLTTDLQPLLPDGATLTANEGGNALVMTDTLANIRRVTEIVAALDTAVSSVSTIRVFPLRFADAKALATTIRELFSESSNSNNRNGRRGGFGGPDFFGGGREGRGGRDNNGNNNNSGGLQGATQVTAVADEHSNSIIVAGPEEYMPGIENLVKSVDTSIQEVTELRVFRLRNADPVEMAQLLTDLFEESVGQDENTRGVGFRFGGGPFGGPFGERRGNRNETGDDSDRIKKQSRVTAVADARTSSIVVSASKDLMGQIAEMVDQLDSSGSRKQKVFVYSLENADVQEVETILRNLFETQNTRNTRANNQEENALNTRANNASQSQGLNSGNLGNFGTGGGVGGNNGGGGGFR